MRKLCCRFWATNAAILALLCVEMVESRAATIALTGTVRDFHASPVHPDFESAGGDDHGIVTTTLGADKKPVYASATTTPTTHGQTFFDQWYRDVAGVNESLPLTITLDNTISGNPDVYRYASSAFFPIDGQLFGNEGRSHNFHFTFELHTQFTFQGGETFSFAGDDDLWVFINNQKVIDLGGVHGEETASVSLNALGLTVGNSYDLDLFFAERHTIGSNFKIDTSILLRAPDPTDPSAVPEPSSMVMCLCALISAAGLRTRRWRNPKAG